MVGIVVDQLRTDYIELLQNRFGRQGFKSLMSDGVYMRDVDFVVPGLDAANSSAMIVTGAYPSQTGVPAASVFDPASPAAGARLPLVSASGSNITNDSFTAAGLRLSTVADELVVDSEGKTSVYSVAADPQQAVILSGHAAKGAYWINNSSGNWAGTSYYGSIPASVSNRNMRRPLAQRVDTMQWRKYKFSRQDRDVYKKFIASPLVNTEITDVAIDIINDLNLGTKPGETDMINVAYTLAPYKYSTDNSRAELEDAYLSLDRQIARLIDAVDRRVGADNSIIWITSTGYYNDALPVEDRYRIPGGEFSAKRAKSLLNSYLTARFGSAGYVSAIRNGQVYFDRHAIESMRLDPSTVIKEARAFLVKMDGVAEAFTIDEILSPATPDLEALRLATDPRRAGDITVRFAPGWKVAYDEQIPVVYDYAHESAVMTPAFVRAPGLEPQVISTPVKAVQIAPTIAGMLHIRSPNGAKYRPIPIGK